MNINKIKSELEQQTCSIHGSKVTVKFENGNITFEGCCCPDFEEKLMDIIDDNLLPD